MQRANKFLYRHGLVVTIIFTVATVLASTGEASSAGFGKLEAEGNFLPHHYDNRTGQFAGAAKFDDSAEVSLQGEIGGIGKATVVQSAAWTWTTSDFGHSCAPVYSTPRGLKTIHRHAGVTTDGDGTAAANMLDCGVQDCGAQSDHTFTATVTITKANGSTINARILGGVNCEMGNMSSTGHGIYSSAHDDAVNRVTTVFEITGGTGQFAGASGDGVLVFTYDTFESHNLRDASIIVNLE
jgi:hypothetical protein